MAYKDDVITVENDLISSTLGHRHDPSSRSLRPYRKHISLCLPFSLCLSCGASVGGSHGDLVPRGYDYVPSSCPCVPCGHCVGDEPCGLFCHGVHLSVSPEEK